MFKGHPFIRLAFLAGATLFATQASAAPTIVNGGFESPVRSPDSLTEITATGVPGWTGNSINGFTHQYIINGNIQDTFGRYFGTTPFGNQYLGLNAISRNGFRSIESQNLSGFNAGEAYSLTVWFANLDGAPDGRINVVATDGLMGTGDTLASQFFTAPVEGPYGQGSIDFVRAVIDFTAISDSVTFSIGNQSFTGVMGIDNVSVQSLGGAVPEPSTWAMLLVGFGLVGSGLRRRRARSLAIA